MKTVFHIGPPKTGTTTLQNTLHDARDYLLTRGVLYPSFEAFGFRNHGALSAGVYRPENLARQFRFLSPERRAELAAGSVKSVADQVDAAAPGLLLLSTEYFSRRFQPDELGRFRDVVTGCRIEEDALTFTLYFRRPSDHYLSRLTQNIKMTSVITPPQPWGLRSRAMALAEAFPAAQLDFGLFSRAALTDGDIVSDFVHRHLRPYGVDPERLRHTGDANVSLSAESSAIMLAARRDLFPDIDNKPTQVTRGLLKTLAEIDADLGLPRPKLKAGIADYLDYCSDDLLWYRDTYGGTLEGYDYARIEAGDLCGAPPGWSDLEDLMVIDRDRQADIVERLLHTKWALNLSRRTWLIGRLKQLKPESRSARRPWTGLLSGLRR